MLLHQAKSKHRMIYSLEAAKPFAYSNTLLDKSKANKPALSHHHNLSVFHNVAELNHVNNSCVSCTNYLILMFGNRNKRVVAYVLFVRHSCGEEKRLCLENIFIKQLMIFGKKGDHREQCPIFTQASHRSNVL